LFRWLFEHPEVKAKHLILLSPHLNGNKMLGDYFDNQIPTDLISRFDRVDMFYSTDDPIPGIVESAESLQKMFPKITVHKFDNLGHFMFDAMNRPREFPELWEVCKLTIL
jgi:hypothetical protein